MVLGMSLGGCGSPPELCRAVMGERKARGRAEDKLFFFFPLISKFLLTLIKRKKKTLPCAPYVPTAPVAASVQRQKVERCFMSWLGGSSAPTPWHAPRVFGVPSARGADATGEERGKAGAKFGDALLPGALQIPQESCSPALRPANAVLEDVDVPRDALLCSQGIMARIWVCPVAWGCNGKDAEHTLGAAASLRAQLGGHGERETTTLYFEFGRYK